MSELFDDAEPEIDSLAEAMDDFDRIEPKNNVAYAAQAVLLTRVATGVDLAPAALTRVTGSAKIESRPPHRAP